MAQGKENFVYNMYAGTRTVTTFIDIKKDYLGSGAC